MQGRGLLILLLICLSMPTWAQEDDFSDFEGLEEFSDELLIGEEPDPSSSLAPPPTESTEDDVSEFESMDETTPLVEEPQQEVAPSPEPIPETQPEFEEPPMETQQAAPEPEFPEPTPSFSEPEAPMEPAPEPMPQPQTPPPSQISGPIDEPDYQKEEKFHRLYRTYNAKPTPLEPWTQATSEARSQVYQVQKGDTLWDVSQTLFGDSSFWPKIWALNNDKVLNPHEISPDMQIRFFPGSVSEVPALSMTGPQSPVVIAEPPLAKAETGEEVVNDGQPPKMPPPFRQSRRLKAVPPSLPLYRYGGVNVPKPNVVIEDARMALKSPLVNLTHYVKENEPVSSGVIKATEVGANSASDFQYIIVELNESSQGIYHVIHEVDQVKNPFSSSKIAGKLFEVQGEIEVLERVTENENMYRAIVKKAIDNVEVGGKLIPGPMPMIDVKPTAPRAAVEATLIGGQYSGERKIYPKFTVVFIDAGSSSGLEPGQSLNVFANLKNRQSIKDLNLKSRRIGIVKIIDTTENFSTAYITEASEDLQIGDSVGGGSAVNAEADVAPMENDDLSLDAETADSGIEEFSEEMDFQDAPAEAEPENDEFSDEDLEL